MEDRRQEQVTQIALIKQQMEDLDTKFDKMDENSRIILY